MRRTEKSSLILDKRMSEIEGQLHWKQENVVDETTQRKTTATSEEDEGAWVRIRRDDFYELRDRAGGADTADQELMSRA